MTTDTVPSEADHDQRRFNSFYFSLMKAALFDYISNSTDNRGVIRNVAIKNEGGEWPRETSDELIPFHEHVFESIESRGDATYLRYLVVHGGKSYSVQYNIYQDSIAGIIGNYLMNPSNRSEPI